MAITGFPAEPAEEKTPVMSLHGADREVRDLVVGDGMLHGDLLAQPAEAGAEDDARLRLEAIGALAEEVSRALDPFQDGGGGAH
jgi:hypothetical protein